MVNSASTLHVASGQYAMGVWPSQTSVTGARHEGSRDDIAGRTWKDKKRYVKTRNIGFSFSSILSLLRCKSKVSFYEDFEKRYVYFFPEK